MTRLLLAAPLLLAAGCATSSTPYAPVRDVAYQAMGGSPTWFLAIGDDRIILRINLGNEETARSLSTFVFARTLPRRVGDVRVWQSGDDRVNIRIDARRSPCTHLGGQVFEDQVHIRWTTVVIRGHADVEPVTQELDGCGDRLLPRQGIR